ncbi:unnamed protein product [Bursaphelenchus xylophilus]|uniref:(pine wood nematode) hypothetical protein n=1 Tax=Bursaphelenchus xylophilus TaxID=6326 RepID=A0A1I7S0T6_BURXY|nr:unnamed protein product [Bursaphelenchus xylophilus]CAG9088418.1 unnamed protein product [Bursaphelenchus xylophilus]
MTLSSSSSTSSEDLHSATLARTRPKTSHGRSYIAGGYYFYDDYRNLTYYIRAGWVPYSERNENEGRMPKTLSPIHYNGPAVFYAYFDEKDNSIYAINYIDQIASEVFVGEKPDPFEFKKIIKTYQPFTLEEMRKKENEKRKSVSMPHLGMEQKEAVATPAKKYSVVENAKLQTNPANFVIRRKISENSSTGYPDEHSTASTTSVQYAKTDMTINSSHLNPLFGRQFDERSVETNDETGYESGDSEVFRSRLTPDPITEPKKRPPTFRQIYTPQKVSMPSNYPKSKSEELYSTLESISEDPQSEEKGSSNRLVVPVRSLRWLKFISG